MTDPSEDDGETTGWASFTIAAMQAERERRSTSFVTVMDDRPFRLGLLHVPRSSELGLITNRLNAVYYVAGGIGRISTEERDIDVEEGYVVFVRGDVEHRIRNVEADLDVVVMFRIATLSSTDSAIVAFSPEEMTQGENLEVSVFNPLLDTSSLSIGMYLVPKGIDRDQLMVHATDELKIVSDGTARFDIGSEGIRVDPGSIAFIRDGVQHQFRRVADPLDVLVVRER